MKEFLDLFLEKSKRNDSNIIYVQMYQNDELKAEYRRFPVKTRLNTWSVSKAFMSMAAGIAMEEGILSLEEPIYPYFESSFPVNAPQTLYQITVKDLLTMSTGQSKQLFFCDGRERYIERDWIRYYFQHGDFIYTPGTHFVYSNFSPYALACMLEQKTGEGLLNYLRYRLFEPLDIGNPDWTLCPMGHCMAANGLYTTIDELSNFCHMILHNGNYKGKQIVSEAYVKDACSRHIDSWNPDTERPDYQSYGYGYYIYMAPIQGAYILSGNYGQYCIIDPERNIVLCVMSLDGNDHKKIRDDLVDAMAEYYHIPLLPLPKHNI